MGSLANVPRSLRGNFRSERVFRFLGVQVNTWTAVGSLSTCLQVADGSNRMVRYFVIARGILRHKKE